MTTITEPVTTLELATLPSSNKNVVSLHQSTTRSSRDVVARTDSRVETKGTTTIVISAISGVTIISAMLAGLVTISLPVMAKDINISSELLLWPASVYSLTCGCTLIVCGAVADVIGARFMYLLGTFLQTVFTMACGLSKNQEQIIVFRALAGVAISFCLPSSVSLIMTYFAAGRRRNLAFGIMGGGQPVGFSVGLVMGGALTDRVGWQVGFYLAAGLNAILFILAFWKLPRVQKQTSSAWVRLRSDIDWIGAMILTTSLALLLYVFATWAGSVANISSFGSISCLVIGIALLPAFALWMHRQQKKGNATLIRNSLWRNKAFTSICMNVFLIWGAFNATEVLITFLFQDVQGLNATAASVRFLPEPAIGAITNVIMGLFVHKMRANWALNISFALSAISPLLLAVSRPQALYWKFVFPAVTLVPISCDVLYTISQLIITAEFDENTQALAGGVFNTVAQIGKSVGLALSAVVASSVSNKLNSSSSTHEMRLFEGYQAAWWFTMSATVTCILITSWGLRGIGKVGLKQE